MKTLLLWLEGPFQSWGHDSKFDKRCTLKFPTLSGVCGLLCCALGAEGSQRSLLDRLSKAQWKVQSYPLKNERYPSILCDFQTVGMGYDESNSWQRLFVPKKADGQAPASVSGVRVTYREYLQSQAFAVFLTFEDEALVQQIFEALLNPVGTLGLGRRNCAPTEIIAQGIFDDETAAQAKASELAAEKDRRFAFEVEEGQPGKDEVFVLQDKPVAFGVRKDYCDRYVKVRHGEAAPWASEFLSK